MNHLHTEAALQACIKEDMDALTHIIPMFLTPNSRIQNFRIGDRPYSSVPFLCVCAAYGNLEAFDYLIEKGATSYYADVYSIFI